LSVRKLCQWLGVSRSWYYLREKRQALRAAKDKELCEAIEAVILEFAGYGYRRVVKELARRGRKVNSKRVLRVMREQGLLCHPKRKFVVTTDSNHSNPVFKNLLRDKELTEPDQVWHADITYVTLPKGFAYLAAILDGYSRKCIGWKLSKRIDTELALGALEMALANRQIKPGLIHHSDRGVQYTSGAYVSRLQVAGITISMSRKGNPYDNAKAESFMKTLKCEEVYLLKFRAKMSAKHFIKLKLTAL
jgi:transposase InsO family protein